MALQPGQGNQGELPIEQVPTNKIHTGKTYIPRHKKQQNSIMFMYQENKKSKQMKLSDGSYVGKGL